MKDSYVGNQYGYSKDNDFLLVEKKNAKNTYHVVPITPKGKRKSGFSILPQEISSSKITVGGNTYNLLPKSEYREVSQNN